MTQTLRSTGGSIWLKRMRKVGLARRRRYLATQRVLQSPMVLPIARSLMQRHHSQCQLQHKRKDLLQTLSTSSHRSRVIRLQCSHSHPRMATRFLNNCHRFSNNLFNQAWLNNLNSNSKEHSPILIHLPQHCRHRVNPSSSHFH